MRLLILGAHPDDAEFHAGGIASLYHELGHTVKMISVTDGAAGHHERLPEQLRVLRKAEAAAAGRVLDSVYETWEFPDGALFPTLEVRHRIIHEIRTFRPDLVLTHRTCDYHPDHRAVGQAVQDASYLVTVPNVLRDVPPLRRDPIVAYMVDLFTRPCPFRADFVLDITDRVDTIVRMLACHETQVFEWLAYQDGLQDRVPGDPQTRHAWLREWFAGHIENRADHFREQLIAHYGETRARQIRFMEAFEISEYAGKLDDATRETLFPFTSVKSE